MKRKQQNNQLCSECTEDARIAVIEEKQDHNHTYIMEKIDDLKDKINENHTEIKTLLKDHMEEEQTVINKILIILENIPNQYTSRKEHEANLYKIEELKIELNNADEKYASKLSEKVIYWFVATTGTGIIGIFAYSVGVAIYNRLALYLSKQ